MTESIHTQSFNYSQSSKKFFVEKMKGQVREIFSCAFLDARYRVICYEDLFLGSINSMTIHPRIVAQKALEYNAAAIVLGHNHPSGIAKPSEIDKETTKQIVYILSFLEIRVLDHIIVGEDNVFSFAEAGLL